MTSSHTTQTFYFFDVWLPKTPFVLVVRLWRQNNGVVTSNDAGDATHARHSHATKRRMRSGGKRKYCNDGTVKFTSSLIPYVSLSDEKWRSWREAVVVPAMCAFSAATTAAAVAASRQNLLTIRNGREQIICYFCRRIDLSSRVSSCVTFCLITRSPAWCCEKQVLF